MILYWVAMSSAIIRIPEQIFLRIRISSAFWSAIRFSSSFDRPMIARGSINAVSPDLDTSWTTPATCPFASILTGMTHLPDLSVMKVSCRKREIRSSFIISSSFFRILPCSRLTCPLSSESARDALSRILPSRSIERSRIFNMSGNPVSGFVSFLKKGRSSLLASCEDMSARIIKKEIKRVSSRGSRIAPSGLICAKREDISENPDSLRGLPS